MTQTAKKEIVTKPGSEISVVNLDVNSVKISELALRCTNLRVDLKNDENYRETQDVINDAREMRGIIKVEGKKLKDDANKWQKKVVSEEKRLDGEIVDFLDPLAARKKVHDDAVKAEKERKKKAEQVRKDAHLANINGIRILISKAQHKPSAEIEKVIAELEAITIDESYEEFQKEASDVYEDTDLALNQMLINVQNREEEDRKREIEADRQRIERKNLDDEKVEMEKMRLKNEEVAKANEKATQELEKQKTTPTFQEEADDLAAVTSPEVIEQTRKSIGISSGSHGYRSSAVQEKIDDDDSVVGQARKNSHLAIEVVISNFGGGNNLALAEDILSAIQAKGIPNIRYDIY